ncbi:hypothetical protein CHLNCDRAFT_135437 [Chlorella variabilis]|uniref:Amino acid transporter transmembrane domain-containing protein n=1 Tax=Chlorella variabilis TaxID=554065 RepID=E1ZI81_CHLVA|nr:hypothetical protein CHLNCDRAFT_135437 [Chlorella variabilis]EFN54731.1 hypothetical protein CHLNCDRAFT_135437 [Chlorella variabilis]|eukprot:XP_005846833.1 hypothetical protein CHLNCDRAFT_135437 [Chlorella variabilis]
MEVRSHRLIDSFRTLSDASLAGSEEYDPTQPLLVEGNTPTSKPPSRLSRLGLPPREDGPGTLPVISLEDSPSTTPGSSILVSVIILAKTIMGAGMAALPHAFEMLGLLTAGAFLLLVAYMTHFTNQSLALGTVVTGHMSYPEVVRVLCGKPGSLLLLLSLVCRCAGLMIIYIIISADVLAGHPGSPGLVCDLLGADGSGWCGNRQLAAGTVAALCIAPLVTPKRLSSTVITSWIGMVAVGTWVVVTAALVGAAAVQGKAFTVFWLPDPDAFSGGMLQEVTQIVAVLPVLGTAYTCQMTIHHIMRDLKPFTERRVTVMSAAAITICTLFFLSVAVGSQVAFGPSIPADVLTLFNAKNLEPLVGAACGRAFYILVRLGFLLSVITIAPSQASKRCAGLMAPYRESLSRLLAGRELQGAPNYLVTYLSLALFYLIAMHSGSIWVPIQFVGATAGALIAFIFPALVALKALKGRDPVGYWQWNAWALIVLGVLQAVAGVAAVLFFSDKGHNASGSGLMAYLF